jgi:hypothetical protein
VAVELSTIRGAAAANRPADAAANSPVRDGTAGAARAAGAARPADAERPADAARQADRVQVNAGAPDLTAYRRAASIFAAGAAVTNGLREVANGVVGGVSDEIASTGNDVAGLARAGLRLATSADAREQARTDATGALRSIAASAQRAIGDPGSALRGAAQVVSGAVRNAEDAYEQAAAGGRGARFVGTALGHGAVVAASLAIPGGAVPRLAAAGDVVRGAATLERASAAAAGTEIAGAARAVTTAYRVEGAGNARVAIGADGSVAIPTVLAKNGAERNLYINFGDEGRAQQFLAQRLKAFPDSTIKQFTVPTSFVEQLRAEAVPESERAMFPQRPVIADPTKASDQYGLSAPHIARLRDAIVPGSGKTAGGTIHGS